MFEHVWDTLKVLLWNAVWAANLAALPPARAGALRAVRVAHMLLREISEGQLALRAASLVYTTLLSLVPVLALCFWVMKAFDMHRQFEPALLDLLQPLGAKGAEIDARIVAFVENLDIRALGSMGLAALLFTVVSLLRKVEEACNYAWRVTKPRTFASRFSGYLTVVMVGPVLVFTALGIGAAVMHHDVVRGAVEAVGVGAVLEFLGKLVPYVLVIAAFTFVYQYLPNTKVRLRSACVGALVAGVLWASAGWAFGALVVTSTRYTAIYSSFAILILFMTWLYIAWLILLAGASVAFYHQHPEYLGLLRHEFRLSSRIRERIALGACFLVARAHFHGRAAWSTAALAKHLRVPIEPLEAMLGALSRAGLVVATGGDAPAWVPARDVGRVTVAEVLAVARSADESRHLSLERVHCEPAVDDVAREVDAAVVDALAGLTLRDLAARNPPAPEPDAARTAPVPITAAKREGTR